MKYTVAIHTHNFIIEVGKEFYTIKSEAEEAAKYAAEHGTNSFYGSRIMEARQYGSVIVVVSNNEGDIVWDKCLNKIK